MTELSTKDEEKLSNTMDSKQLPTTWSTSKGKRSQYDLMNPPEAMHVTQCPGIKFNFPTVLDACLYMLETYGVPDRNMELDRIDSNGNYEPGNLRWVTREQNQANRRLSIIPDWDPKEWPYARSVVTRKLSAGMTREEIIEEAKDAVKNKRKNWQGIQKKLMSMTSSTQGQDTDTQ